MHSESPDYFYTLLSPDFFESINNYKSSDEFRRIARQVVGPEWSIAPVGFWTYCSPHGSVPIQQGWKIHVSAVPSRGTETLERILPLVAARRTEFKFASDRIMLTLSLNKNWSRTGAGKFITIYPRDEDEFLEVIALCDAATKDLVGPFILSDRPFRDSRVVFYRYGEHMGVPGVSPLGHRVARIKAPDGSFLSDDRKAYFTLPDWITDPFSSAPLPSPPQEGVLLKNRYRVMSALKFSSIGGVYTAEDTLTGQQVVIREARPFLSEASKNFNALDVLEKEARILRKLGGTGYMAQFVDLFQEWEHLFLVQERFMGAESLWGHSMNIVFAPEVTPALYFERLRTTIEDILRGVQVVHDHGVVLRDLTRNNVMFTPDARVRFVDLEFGYELDRGDPAVAGFTPGYASREQRTNSVPSVQEDHYALGVLILDMIAYTAPGFDLNREALLDAFRMTLDDLRQPRDLHDVVVGLTAPEPSQRWTPARAIAALQNAVPPTCDTEFLFPRGEAPRRRPSPSTTLRRRITDVVEGINSYTAAHTSLDRNDRLWPCSGDAFHTNPVQFQFGAAGTALAMVRTGGELPDGAVQWIIDHLWTKPAPPTLCSGLGGAAVTLLELGEHAAAAETLAKSGDPELVYARRNLYYGAAGWGLTNLHFWAQTGESSYLDAATEVGRRLVAEAVTDERGTYWTTEGVIELGFGQGQSGIATFLVFLAAVRPDEEFLSTALAALAFEREERFESDYDLLWYPNVDASPSAPKSPHMRHGTAGVGSAMIRAYALTKDERLLAFARRCAHVVSRRQTNKLWHDYGLAGYGEFLVDMFQFTGDDSYLNSGYHLAEALILHGMRRAEGIAFLGAEMLRISCDYGMGSAGIGAFLHRLVNPTTPRLLMLDHLLAAAVDEPRSLQLALR